MVIAKKCIGTHYHDTHYHEMGRFFVCVAFRCRLRLHHQLHTTFLRNAIFSSGACCTADVTRRDPV